eukprot:2229292-Pleurochrysis_carterae.AAC.3
MSKKCLGLGALNGGKVVWFEVAGAATDCLCVMSQQNVRHNDPVLYTLCPRRSEEQGSAA